MTAGAAARSPRAGGRDRALRVGAGVGEGQGADGAGGGDGDGTGVPSWRVQAASLAGGLGVGEGHGDGGTKSAVSVCGGRSGGSIGSGGRGTGRDEVVRGGAAPRTSTTRRVGFWR